MIIAVDFDNTLCNMAAVPVGYRMGPPMDGAVTAIRVLVNQGHQIIIFTARSVDKPAAYKAVEDWLKFFDIPHHGITNIKRPEFDVMLDDRGLHFSSWPEALHDLTAFENGHRPHNRVQQEQGMIKDITRPLTDPDNLL